MTMDNGRFLGSTAGLIAVGGAWAAHLLVKANPNSCSRSEASYTPKPRHGIKLDGYLRAEVTFNGSIQVAPTRRADRYEGATRVVARGRWPR